MSSTGNGIAAGVHALTGGKAILVDDDTALLIDLQTLGGGVDQEVGAGAQAHDDRVHRQLKLAALLLHRAAAAGGIRLAQLHLDALHGLDPILLVAMDLVRGYRGS